MYEVMIEGSFAAAHRLLNYEGICENQHGHNWKVQVCAVGEHLDKSGILIDYKIISNALQEILSILDHTDLNNLECFTNMSTSSELIAKYVFIEMKKRIKEISRVTVWETDKASASYWE